MTFLRFPDWLDLCSNYLTSQNLLARIKSYYKKFHIQSTKVGETVDKDSTNAIKIWQSDEKNV